jgi:hypothetical protein
MTIHGEMCNKFIYLPLFLIVPKPSIPQEELMQNYLNCDLLMC